jgi:hypothetical protein
MHYWSSKVHHPRYACICRNLLLCPCCPCSQQQASLEASGAQHVKAAPPAALPLQPPPTNPTPESPNYDSTTTGCAIGSSIRPGGGSSGSGKGWELAVKPALDQGVPVSDRGSTCGVSALGRKVSPGQGEAQRKLVCTGNKVLPQHTSAQVLSASKHS